MSTAFTEQELEAYLEETLDPQRAALLERAASSDAALLQRLAYINSRRNAGIHTLGEIWRRNQIGVPSRERIAHWLMAKLPREEAAYIQFRLDVLKCRYTQALVTDVQREHDVQQSTHSSARRAKLFKKGANLVERRKPKQS